MGPRGLLLGALGLVALVAPGAGGDRVPAAGDAAQEHGYYLGQLFGQYGANGTLPSEGLARLLGSLGLGRVRVVQIQHEELGHGHVTHLDLLEVQDDKHRHRHPLAEHAGAPPASPRTPRYSPRPRGDGWRVTGSGGLIRVASRSPRPALVTSWTEPPPAEPPGVGDTPAPPQRELSLLGRVLGLEHSGSDHPHHDVSGDTPGTPDPAPRDPPPTPCAPHCDPPRSA